MKFFFILITCLLDIVLIWLGEILSWSFTMYESWRFTLTWDMIILNQLFTLTKNKQTNASQKCFFFYCLCFPSYWLVLKLFPWLSWTHEVRECSQILKPDFFSWIGSPSQKTGIHFFPCFVGELERFVHHIQVMEHKAQPHWCAFCCRANS